MHVLWSCFYGAVCHKHSVGERFHCKQHFLPIKKGYLTKVKVKQCCFQLLTTKFPLNVLITLSYFLGKCRIMDLGAPQRFGYKKQENFSADSCNVYSGLNKFSKFLKMKISGLLIVLTLLVSESAGGKHVYSI